MLEALVTLSVLSLTIAMLSNRNREPSAALQLSSLASALKSDAATHRARAIIDQDIVVFSIEKNNCENALSKIIFYPDGTVLGDDICLEIDDDQLTLQVNSITAQLYEESAQ